MSQSLKRIVILPYFGKFNSYFKLWLDSCSKNASIDWLIVTDCDIPYALTNNISVVKTTMAQLKADFQKRFDFKISLEKPYKLCDYKPLYGYLFSEYVNGYDFWGYCDCDLVFGDIDVFLDSNLFQQYDKVLRNGHLSFIRNTKDVSEVFRKYETYRVVFASPAIYNYDEAVGAFRPGFAAELVDSGFKLYQNSSDIADIKYTNFPFHIVSAPEISCVFTYENGKTYKINRNPDKSITKTEVMYLHLQKRKMEVMSDFTSGSYLIYPNRIVDYDESIILSDDFWSAVSAEKDDYFDPWTDRKDIIKRDILRFLHEPNKFKSLKHRFFR